MTVTTYVGGDGQTTFRYSALCNPDLPSDQVGWVREIDGPHALAAHYVTPGEIVRDLRKMKVDEDVALTFLHVATKDMLAELATRPARDHPESATAKRIALLSGEIERLPTTTPQELRDDVRPTETDDSNRELVRKGASVKAPVR